MTENQFPVELETYLADGQANAREQEARMQARVDESTAKLQALAVKEFEYLKAGALACGVPEAALRFAVVREVKDEGKGFQRRTAFELRIPQCAPIFVLQDTLHDQATDVRSLGAPYYRVPSDVDDDGEGNAYWSAYSVQEFSDFEDALAFAHQRYPRLAAFEARMAESAARYAAMKQAKAAAEAEQIEHDEKIRDLLMDNSYDPTRGDVGNLLKMINCRLTAIGMVLQDIAIAQRGEK